MSKKLKKSLFESNPELCKEWHPKLNGDITPFNVTSGSQKKVWWQCFKGHEYETRISDRNKSGCPYCSGHKTNNENCLATLNPKLAKEWHPTLNNDLTPYDKVPGSHKKVWWKCIKGHEWEAVIDYRNRGTNCPYCNHNSSYPEQVIYFYMRQLFVDCLTRYKINSIEIDVYIPQLKLGIEYDGYYFHKNKLLKDIKKSNKLKELDIKLIRVREKGLAIIDTDYCILRTDNTYNNSDLSKNIIFIISYINKYYNTNYELNVDVERDHIKILESIKYIEVQNSIKVKFPELALEWHTIKNGNILPENISYGSNTKYWWFGSCGHEWETSPNVRKRGYGCPYCSNQKVNEENCLATTNPKLAKEWHPILNNDLTSYDIVVGSNKKVWWLGECGHEWEAIIVSRYNGANCPYCSGNKVCIDNCLATINPELAAQWHSTKNNYLTPKDVTRGSNKKVWWQCEKGHEWETFIKIRTRINDINCPHCRKENRSKKSLK